VTAVPKTVLKPAPELPRHEIGSGVRISKGGNPSQHSWLTRIINNREGFVERIEGVARPVLDRGTLSIEASIVEAARPLAVLTGFAGRIDERSTLRSGIAGAPPIVAG
jgi:hypothetical protein